jgi:hypothetical protein
MTIKQEDRMTGDDLSEAPALGDEALADEVAANHLDVTLDRILNAPSAEECRDMVQEAKKRGRLGSTPAPTTESASSEPSS